MAIAYAPSPAPVVTPERRRAGVRRLPIDAVLALGLAAMTLATRIPLRTEMLYNWDSANYALALQHFDVTQHRPHPPGNPLFIAAAQLFYQAGLDPNTSLVLTSTLLSAAAVVALFYLGRNAFGRAAGLAAALMLLTSVSFWSAGEVALPYAALGLFSSLTALFVWRTAVQGRREAMPATLAYSLGAGFRPDLLFLLGPMWLAGLWGQPRRTQVSCVVVACLGVLLWLVPTALLSGGFPAYLAVLSAYFGVDVVEKYSSTQSGSAGLLRNLRDTASYIFYGLYATAPLLGIAAVWWGRRWKELASRQGLVLAAWLVPILLFYTVLHIGDPGYAFSLLPALLLITARPLGLWLEGARGRTWRLAAAGVLALALAANAALFLARPGVLTLPGLRANDASLRSRIERIRSDYPPESTMLLSYYTYKHLQIYLPVYRHNAWADIYRPGEQPIPIGEGITAVLLVDPVLEPSAGMAAETVPTAPGVTMALLPIQPGQTLVARGARVSLR